MKCIVYNLEGPHGDPAYKKFYGSVNGVRFEGNCDEEVDLDEAAIGVLNNAIIDREVVENGKKRREVLPRFRVVVLEAKQVKVENKDETKEIPVSEKYICDICGKEFENNIALLGHKRSHK